MIGQLLTGRYLILEKLGGGGFSETYLARDKYLPHHPLCVVKSLQLSDSSTLSPETALQLFETEAKLLEQLGQHHAQIPTLLAYSHEQEQAYLIQEYIEGESLRHWLTRQQRLTIEAAVKLLSEMLSILTYLHSRRIAHCDIKPSNIIRRKRDGKLVLIDFGAACQVPETPSGPSTSSVTNELQMAIGTPDYMPDEQKLGYTQLNSDLYALGILVIHLLTGILPRQFQRDLISGQLDWQTHLADSTPNPRLIALLNRMVQSDFRDRYQQATDVLADLQALPMTKRFQSPRVRGLQGLVPKVAFPAMAGILLGAVGIQYGHTQSQLPELWLNQLEQRFHPSPVQLTMMHDVSVQAGVDRMVIAPNNRILVTAGSDHALRLWSLPTGTLFNTLMKHGATITALNISQNSKLLVSGREDGSIDLWDLSTGRLLRSFAGHRQPVMAVAISPDGSTVVSGCKEGKIRRWDAQTGVRLQTMQLLRGGVTALTYDETSDRLISASSDSARADASARQIQVWDLNSSKLVRTFVGHTATIDGLQVAGDHMLFSVGKDRGLMWDLKREELVTVFPQDSADAIATSFNEQNIVTVHDNGSIRVWMRKAGRLVQRETGALGRNLDVALSPNHRYLVSWSADRRLRVWQLNASNIQ
ncbi:MAG: serine/threonine protein kinase [Stenomitos rutilans HA7619-LM2]|jgi:predicted Ser/Thr protein kinase|nr:serine/threonine protein kinase [Stenomitos rutilans HA7619-LM2]